MNEYYVRLISGNQISWPALKVYSETDDPRDIRNATLARIDFAVGMLATTKAGRSIHSPAEETIPSYEAFMTKQTDNHHDEEPAI